MGACITPVRSPAAPNKPSPPPSPRHPGRARNISSPLWAVPVDHAHNTACADCQKVRDDIDTNQVADKRYIYCHQCIRRISLNCYMSDTSQGTYFVPNTHRFKQK